MTCFLIELYKITTSNRSQNTTLGREFIYWVPFLSHCETKKTRREKIRGFVIRSRMKNVSFSLDLIIGAAVDEMERNNNVL